MLKIAVTAIILLAAIAAATPLYAYAEDVLTKMPDGTIEAKPTGICATDRTNCVCDADRSTTICYLIPRPPPLPTDYRYAAGFLAFLNSTTSVTNDESPGIMHNPQDVANALHGHSQQWIDGFRTAYHTKTFKADDIKYFHDRLFLHYGKDQGTNSKSLLWAIGVNPQINEIANPWRCDPIKCP